MNITLKGLNSLTSAEITFIFAMMQKHGGLDLNKKPVHNKNKNRKKQKTVKDHDKCTSKEPCLYDFDCPAWDRCDDDKFLQYRLIMKKCEK